MYTFMFLLIPVCIASYCIKMRDKNITPIIIAGTLSSIIFSSFKFFFFMHRITPFSFWANFVYVLFGQVLFPSAIVFAIFLFYSKDGFSLRMKMFFPLVSSFYAIYLPFHIISINDTFFTPFELFVKPVMYLFFLIGEAHCVRIIYSAATKIKPWNTKKNIEIMRIVVCSFVFLIVIFAPAVAESFWLIKDFWIKWFLIFIVYVAVILLWTFFYFKNDYKDDYKNEQNYFSKINSTRNYGTNSFDTFHFDFH